MTTEELRLKLLENGYSPLANYDKRVFFKGWPTVEITPEEIHKWSRRNKRFTATGLRVENGLCVVDVDINVDDDALWAALDVALAPVLDTGLIRTGKGTKIAIFCRTSETFSRIHTRRWLAPGALPDDDTHCVEIFGGGAHRQFGAFGPHTIRDDGSVAVAYDWDGPSPCDVGAADLPVFDKAVQFQLCDAVEDVLKQFGFTPVLASTSGESEAQHVYDLTPEMSFDCADGARRTLEDLRGALAGDSGADIRCSASWLEGPQAKRTDRCLVRLERGGGIAIWESSSGITHHEESRKPQKPDIELELNRLAEKLKEVEDRARNRVKKNDDAMTTAAKLLETYAFCPSARHPVVPIYTGSLDGGHMSMQNFRTLWLPNADEDVGPRGGRITINPADIWAGATQRRSVDGIQMRPDQPRPLFEEGGAWFVNCYDPPLHDIGKVGDAAPWAEFIESLLPDDNDRRWFTRWLAHKYRYPQVPGPGVVMVARKQGTGRGTLGEILKKLFGERYVPTISYENFVGRTYQSQYNDWQAMSLITLVNESSEAAVGGSYFKAKHDSYERLKELVEPRSHRKQFIIKGERAFDAPCFASTLISTNNVDALPIPQEDRRFGILTNGEPREPAFWSRFNAWLEEEGSTPAIVAWLLAVDLVGYSPYEAPGNLSGRAHMIDMAKSDLDHAFEIVEANLVTEVFVPDQIIAAIRQVSHEYADIHLPDKWEAATSREIRKRYYRIGKEKDGPSWQIKYENRKFAPYATSLQGAEKWFAVPTLRDEVLKNGSPAATGLPGNVLLGLFRQSKEGDVPEQ